MKSKMQLARTFMLMMILLMSAYAYGSYGSSCYVQFKLCLSSGLSETPDDYDPEGIRKPGKHIIGTIDVENGIQIPDLNKSLVVSYEIYNNGMCIGSWNDESDFISFLTEYEEAVEIRINLPECYFSGYIDLPLQ